MTGVFIFIGGGFGSLARWLIHRAMHTQRIDLPVATFLVNLTGAFLIGLLHAYFLEKTNISEELKLGIGFGVLGGFTTFSALSLEALKMVSERSIWLGASYIGLSSLLGLLFAFLGFVLGKQMS